MKVRIELDENLDEDELIIRCSKIDTTIQKIQQAVSNITSMTQKYSFFKDEKEYYLPIDSILFFETSDNSISAHTTEDVYKTKYRLYELEKILSHNFIRVSKSTILNCNHILSINRKLASLNIVQFCNSYKQVYVSRYYFKDLRKRLDERRSYEN